VRTAVVATLRAAITERGREGVRLTVSTGPDAFVAGEATAVISALQGGPPLPSPQSKPPTMRTGLRRRPVLLSNVETFARLAIAARTTGLRSSLVSVSGAVATPGVLEVDTATPIGALLTQAGADPALAAIITGGWHGSWLPADTATFDLPADRAALRAAGAHFGAGALIAVPHDPCPVLVLQAIAAYLTDAGAGQCAPCVLGLAAAQRDLQQGGPVLDRVQRRGLCAHPTATLSALQSGQRLLAGELARHAQGRCGVTR
jgi:NADH:ubiquinone oxidoreductase subunit F (NADH-binding)